MPTPRTADTILAAIRARRDELTGQMDDAKQQYVALERTLILLGRQLDAMHGGLVELDALLAHCGAEAEDSCGAGQVVGGALGV